MIGAIIYSFFAVCTCFYICYTLNTDGGSTKAIDNISDVAFWSVFWPALLIILIFRIIAKELKHRYGSNRK